jgi:hypothetical protein
MHDSDALRRLLLARVAPVISRLWLAKVILCPLLGGVIKLIHAELRNPLTCGFTFSFFLSSEIITASFLV